MFALNILPDMPHKHPGFSHITRACKGQLGMFCMALQDACLPDQCKLQFSINTIYFVLVVRTSRHARRASSAAPTKSVSAVSAVPPRAALSRSHSTRDARLSGCLVSCATAASPPPSTAFFLLLRPAGASPAWSQYALAFSKDWNTLPSGTSYLLSGNTHAHAHQKPPRMTWTLACMAYPHPWQAAHCIQRVISMLTGEARIMRRTFPAITDDPG